MKRDREMMILASSFFLPGFDYSVRSSFRSGYAIFRISGFQPRI